MRFVDIFLSICASRTLSGAFINVVFTWSLNLDSRIQAFTMYSIVGEFFISHRRKFFYLIHFQGGFFPYFVFGLRISHQRRTHTDILGIHIGEAGILGYIQYTISATKRDISESFDKHTTMLWLFFAVWDSFWIF